MAAEQVNFEIEEVNVGKDDVKLIDTLVRLVEHHEKVSDLRVMGYEVVEGEIVRFITSDRKNFFPLKFTQQQKYA